MYYTRLEVWILLPCRWNLSLFFKSLAWSIIPFKSRIHFPSLPVYFAIVHACTHAGTYTHPERESEKKSLKMKGNSSPSAASPHLSFSLTVSVYLTLFSPLLSLLLWNSTCYRLTAWELRHDVVCTPTWYSASSQSHIQPCWCARQTSWDVFILQELNDFLENCR